jgi:TonB family protein
MSRAAAVLLAWLLVACAGVNTREVVVLPALFVCGHYPYDFEEPPIKPIKIPHVSPISSAVYSPQPRYPYEARLNRWEATLSLELVVRSDGTVRDAKVVQTSGHPVLDRSAVDAFLQWRFKVGIADQIRIPVTYSLRCPKIAQEQHRNRIRE